MSEQTSPSVKTPRPIRKSLVDEVARVLREQIADARWEEFLPGEHQLCAELHVSRMTLRAALGQLAHQRWLVKGGHGRRHRITHRASASTSPRDTEVRILSLIPADRIVGVMQTAMTQFRMQLEAAGYKYRFHSVRLPPGRRAESELARIVAQPSVGCWVLYCASEPMQRWFAEKRLPCVVLGATFPEVRLPSVEFDARAIARHAAHEFLRRGHTRIALVRPTLVLAGDMQCAAGLKEGMRQHPGASELVDLSYEPTPEGIRRVMKRALGGRQPPTAFFVAQPNFVWPVVGCLWQSGRRVPQDAAVISRGDDLFIETSVPSVARYEHDGVKLGATAARLVLSVAQSASQNTRSRKLMPVFVPGETLG